MKPSRLLIALCAGLLALALLLGSLSALNIRTADWLHMLCWSCLCALILLAVVDALWLRRLPTPNVERQLPGNLSIGYWDDIQLSVTHELPHEQTITLFDHVPHALEYEQLPLRVKLIPGHTSRCQYPVRPLQRGQFHFPCCELWLNSPLKLWQGKRKLDIASSTRVYPDFAKLYGAELSGVENLFGQLGIRQAQRRGLGLEFHQLRDFRDGDSLRQIDWKATARKRSVIAREYQDERDQQIIFLLDCGRRMRSLDGELSHFDHSLNASLLLSYVALRQGDAVGLSTFAGDERFVAAHKGQAHLRTLLNAVYDLDSSQRPADYAQAITQLQSRLKRRALVVLITNLRDEDNEQLLKAAKQLGSRHRLLIASLRDEVLDETLRQPISDHDQAVLYCGTQDYLLERSQLHSKLIAHGLNVLDTRPSALGPELVTRYLTWKKAGSL